MIAGHSIGIVEKKGFSFSFSLSLSSSPQLTVISMRPSGRAIGGDVKEDDGVGHFDGGRVVEEEEEGREEGRWFWRRE